MSASTVIIESGTDWPAIIAALVGVGGVTVAGLSAWLSHLGAERRRKERLADRLHASSVEMLAATSP